MSMTEVEHLKELMEEKLRSVALALELKGKEDERRFGDLESASKTERERQDIASGTAQGIKMSWGAFVAIMTIVVAVVAVIAYIVIKK